MTEQEIKENAKRAADEKLFCRLLCKFEYEPRFILPLKASEGLFLSAIESGMSFDGYLVERFQNVDSLKALEPEQSELARRKGLFDSLDVPQLETGSLQQIFAYLVTESECVYLELGSPDSREISFETGLCVDCSDTGLRIVRFDTGMRRDRSATFIPYSSVVRLVFGTRSLKARKKYLSNNPQ